MTMTKKLQLLFFLFSYTYSIIEGNEDQIFSIGSSSGHVYIPATGSRELDFDMRRTHNLTVQAQNNVQLCQRARIRINIQVIRLRINFNSIPPIVQIMETSRISDTVVQVVATGGAGQISYSITDGNSAGDFNIDANTGIIRVNQMLNFETSSMYRLVVRAESIGTTVTGDQVINIGIQDINEPPIFNSCTMSSNGCTYNINENEPSTILGRIVVSDPDLNSLPNGMLSYSLNISGLPFEVDPSGNLRTTAPLDREDQRTYRFTVIIMDRCSGCALSVSTDLTVNVNDLNDNTPMFTLFPTTAQVSEDSQRGIVVAEYRAMDADSGANAAIIFTLSPSNSPFSLNSTGTLSLTGDIDFEITQSYDVTITVSNTGRNHSSSVNTNIQVINVNDNSPVITGESYAAIVAEDSAINTLILTITAMDADLGSQIQYSIIRGNFQDYIALNPSSGALTLNRSIDRETVSSITLLVEAKDRGTPQPKNDRTNVTITITDVNDNRPIFRPDTYSVEAREDLQVGHVVLEVNATDADEPNTANSNIIYSFTRGNSADKFRISSNGQIQINNALDFETTSSYTLLVEARDEGNPIMHGTANVTITVINVNDNSPVITGEPYAAMVAEDSTINTLILTITAMDADLGSQIQYSIIRGNFQNYIALNPSSGALTLNRSIDRETISSITLLVEAKDRGTPQPKNDRTNVSITITDVNDNRPIFRPDTYSVEAREDLQEGHVVLEVNATDADEPNTANSNIIYSFTRGNSADKFRISSNGQIQINNALDFETTSSYTLLVEARDEGNPIMHGTANVTITVINVNDNSPVITGEPYAAMVAEDSTINTLILTITAMDADLGSQIQYSIIRGNFQNYIALNPSSGALILNRSIDRETVSSITLLVEAKDRGTPQPKNDRTNVTITITDVNDNRPIFRPDTYSVEAREDLQVGHVVLEVNATDADEPNTANSNIIYSFTRGNSADKFRISSNGQIQINNALDFETTSSYTLLVEARDEGNPIMHGTANVTITVINVNDNSPVITGEPYAAMVAEDSAINTLILTITAMDADLGSQIQYSIIRGNFQNYIALNPSSGALTLNRSIDRETVSSITLLVEAKDRGTPQPKNDRTNVTITITDVNDNRPIFRPDTYSVEAREDLQVGHVVLEVNATDADEPNTANSNIIYSFTRGNSADKFRISSNGQIQINNALDFETTSSYTLLVEARDEGNPIMHGTANVTITVINVNDNSPVITGEPYAAMVAEDSTINTLILTITAMDADLGSQIQYSIIRGNFQNYIALNPSSGALTLNRSIDRETVSSITLLVEAKDRGTPQPKNDRTNITITITDVNDNQPIFRPDTFSVEAREDLQVGHVVLEVIATDADETNTANSNIIYSFTRGNSANKFRISPNGQIQINNTLDFETTSSYSLVVEARDEGNPIMRGTANVAITVINVNENPPTLTGDQVVDISESTLIDSTIAIFLAQDQDQMAIFISIVSGNDERKFAIGNMTGEITLVAGLDYEITTAYALVIRASDGELSAEASLSVTIIDENEFSPMFLGTTSFTIQEEQQTGSRVGTIKATDGDRGAVLTYEFVRQDPTTENFILDSSTGVITTRNVLNRENMTQVFNPPLSQVIVQISAMDNGTPTLRTLMDYSITLEDINDNAPIFADPSYSNQLLENLSTGQSIFTIAVTDADIGSNEQVSFSFTLTNNQGPSNPFQINSATGAIENIESLDYEVQPFYLFDITVRDGGSPSLSSTTSGNLTLIDVNDNAPQFSQNIFHLNVSEAFNPGDVVMTFIATDADKGENAQVEYFVLLNQNRTFLEKGLGTIFQIDMISGALSTLNLFDFEISPQVNVSIFANDRGLPQMTGTTTLVIDIMNIDEEPPIFQAMTCDTTVSEDISIGTVVTSCTATDPDTIATGNQLPVTYSLINQFFDINSTNGDIITKVLLDREINSEITVTITVTDLSGRNAFKLVLIKITDVNDTPPQFLGASFSYHFTDNAIQSYTQEFLNLQVDDPDLGSNGTFTLSIGRTVKVTDTETQVEVIAQDSGSPQLTNSINISVTFQSPCQLQTYSITPDEVHLSAQLLCTIEFTPSPSFPVVFGMSVSLICRIISNSPTEYQWLHNGTILTNTELLGQGRTKVHQRLRDIRFSDAGEYVCIASSQAGSLQSPPSTAAIQGMQIWWSLRQYLA